MKIKICGLSELSNIAEIAALDVDMVGFIFYKKSPRFVKDNISHDILKSIPKRIQKVGVFVDEDLEIVLQKVVENHLDVVQLHGNETASYCKKLKTWPLCVIKAFGIDAPFDFSILKEYEGVCDFFLFDTKGKKKGGNGISFNWEILGDYRGNTPFLLSGGLGLHNIQNVLAIRHPRFSGVDINSKAEIKTGIKSSGIVKSLIREIQEYERDKTR